MKINAASLKDKAKAQALMQEAESLKETAMAEESQILAMAEAAIGVE